MKEGRKIIPNDELKKIVVDLLLEFDNFCRKNDLKYYLYAGTLLGAVRHSGFIPWDDDIDVCMLREDYNKFLATYSGSSSKYKLLSLDRSKHYYYAWARLINNETVLVESHYCPEELGVYLDIFPIDDCPGESLEEARKSRDWIGFMVLLRNCKIIKFSKERKVYKNAILLLGKIITLPLSVRKIAQMTSKKASKKSKKKCRYVGGVVDSSYAYGSREVFERSCFGEGIPIMFEGHEFVAPLKYDCVLKSLYGDYMELPPIEKRVSNHAFCCWYK